MSIRDAGRKPGVVRPHGKHERQLCVGGLTPLTTVDYPGELAAVVFCQGCPWRCRYCHNGGLLEPRGAEPIAWQDVLEFLRTRRGLLDAVVFSGGEPTLQTALPEAIAQARRLGLRIGLHTGGAYPKRLQRILPLIDWVGMDIKALPEDYPAITGVAGSGDRAWESLRLIQAAGVPHEVRITVLPDWRARDLASIGLALHLMGVEHLALQACDTEHALDPSLAASTTSTRTPLADLARGIDPAAFSSLILRGH